MAFCSGGVVGRARQGRCIWTPTQTIIDLCDKTGSRSMEVLFRSQFQSDLRSLPTELKLINEYKKRLI